MDEQQQQELIEKELKEAPFGRYPDGQPISEHPSQDEINKYYDYYVSIASQEEQEIVDILNDTAIGTNFLQFAPQSDREACVEMALGWWAKYWPHEVSIFMDDVERIKQNLLNGGYSADEDKAQKLIGKIPARVLNLLRMLDAEYWYTQKGYDTIYKVFKKGLIS